MKNRMDDPIFQLLVDKFYEIIEKEGWSLQEMFDSATIAALRYEIQHRDDPQNRI
jgi:hypothetical protein